MNGSLLLTGKQTEKEREDLDEEIEVSSIEIKDNLILEIIEDKLDESWYKGTESDDEDLLGITEYLDIQGYDEFTNPEDEAYEQRRCKLLGIPYKEPPPIHTETFEVTRYSIGPNEQFSKVVSNEKKEFSRTVENVAWIRGNLMKEMDGLGQVRRPP